MIKSPCLRIYDKRRKFVGEHSSPFNKIIHLNIERSASTDAGLACYFWKYGNIGLKGYRSLDEALEAYKLQNKAYRIGVGPKVYDRVIIYKSTIPDYQSLGDYEKYDRSPVVYFGYETEIAQPIHVNNRNGSMTLFKENHKQVLRKLNKIGMGDDLTLDDYRNFGIVNGKLVCVDFGSESQLLEG